MYFCISVFVTLAYAVRNLKSLKHKINYKKKDGPTKYPRESNFDPQNTHERTFRSHEYPRENFRPTKYPREKILDPRNIHEKKFWTQEIPTKTR